jgi:hypothetical protein
MKQILCILMAIVVVGCGTKFTGTYTGVQKVSNSSINSGAWVDKQFTVKLEENSKEGTVSGSYTLTDGGTGSVSGTIDQMHDNWVTSLTFKDADTNTCPGTYTGVLKVGPDDLDKLVGNVSGTATCGTVSITFDLTKQN